MEGTHACSNRRVNLLQIWRLSVHEPLPNRPGDYRHQLVRPTLFRSQVKAGGNFPQGDSMSTEHKAIVRCAIYTRKSTEEGLEQPFNSLNAQREACEAFIAS